MIRNYLITMMAIASFATLAVFKNINGETVFRYADSVTTTGGQFGPSYPPTNLMNDEFDSATQTIDTRDNYFAAGNNYATASGTISNFNLTFEFDQPSKIDGMYVWNYVFRNGSAGATSPTCGVKGYTLTFYTSPKGTGSVINSIFSGTLLAATYNALNSAQTIKFTTAYQDVRSVVMHVSSNYGSTDFTGMNEIAFNAETGEILGIQNFTSSAPLLFNVLPRQR
jgi:hypothetical protein